MTHCSLQQHNKQTDFFTTSYLKFNADSLIMCALKTVNHMWTNHLITGEHGHLFSIPKRNVDIGLTIKYVCMMQIGYAGLEANNA